jgi:shikimate kinase
LLAGDDLRARVNALMDARRDAYAQIANHIDTTGKSAEQIADEIIARVKSR